MKISEEKFNIIYDEYSQELFNIAYGYSRNKDDSNDIVQNVFMKFIQLNKEFKTSDDMKYYLVRMTINESINLVKSYTKRKVLLDNEYIANVPNFQNEDEKLCKISYLINILPMKYKTIIILHYYDMMRIKDIAKTLNISESAVKKRLERGRHFLKSYLERENKND